MEQTDVLDEVKDLSPEELKERRQKITDYYSEHIPHLKIQLEYEELLTSIEKLRAERYQAQMFLAQAYQEQSQEQGDKEPTERKLKRT